jgi:hypothetical protein
LWKNPENLTGRQQAKLAWVAKTDPRLHRAYLLKEGLRLVFQLPHDEAESALEVWIGWARRCQIPASSTCTPDRETQGLDPRRDRARLLQQAHRIGEHQDPAHHPDRVRIQIPEALIAVATLNFGGHRPVLPGGDDPRECQESRNVTPSRNQSDSA